MVNIWVMQTRLRGTAVIRMISEDFWHYKHVYNWGNNLMTSNRQPIRWLLLEHKSHKTTYSPYSQHLHIRLSWFWRLIATAIATADCLSMGCPSILFNKFRLWLGHALIYLYGWVDIYNPIPVIVTNIEHGF